MELEEDPGGTEVTRYLALLIAAAAFSPSSVRAESPRMDLQRFRPAAQQVGFVLVREADGPQSFTLAASVTAAYGLQPLTLVSNNLPRGGVEHLGGLHLGLLLAPTPWLQIGLSAPVLQQVSGGGLPAAMLAKYDLLDGGLAAGDLSLEVALQPLRQSDTIPISLALRPRFVLPTGNQRLLLGGGSFDIGLDVAVARSFPWLRLAANLGFIIDTAGGELLDLFPDDELRWALGLGVPLGATSWELQVEWVGTTVLASPRSTELRPFDPAHTPTELALGLRWLPEGPISVAFGGGPGIGSGFGSPTLRLFAQVTADWGRRPAPPEPCPECDPCPEPQPCPQPEPCPAAEPCPEPEPCPSAEPAAAVVTGDRIELHEQVRFEVGSATIDAASGALLDRIAELLLAHPEILLIELQGHTDPGGSATANREFSRRRAGAVRDALIARGVDGQRLQARGYGSDHPLPGHATAEELRRVELHILRREEGSQ